MLRTAKYIWMQRNPLAAAKSTVRMKFRSGKENTGYQVFRRKLTTRKALEIYHNHQQEYERVMPHLKHIKVDLEELKYKDQATIDRISEFIGCPLNTDEITLKQTWPLSGKEIY